MQLLIRVPIESSSKQNKRRLRFAAQSKQRPEIDIRRHESPIFCRGSSDYDFVRSCVYFVFANMNCIVPRVFESRCDVGRQGVVDEEFQAPISGSSRSRKASAA